MMPFHRYLATRLCVSCFFIIAGNMVALAATPIVPVDPNDPKTISVEANEGGFDNLNQVYELRGKVVVKRGGMVFESDKAVIKQDNKGYKNLVLSGSKTKLAHFRDVRPQTKSVAEGYAQTIEYDDLTEVVQLAKEARITRWQNDKQTEEVKGEQITYNVRTEFFHLKNNSGKKNSRVQIIIQPRN